MTFEQSFKENLNLLKYNKDFYKKKNDKQYIK